MKRRSLAAAVLVIYIVLLIPAGTAFADDYVDHNNNTFPLLNWMITNFTGVNRPSYVSPVDVELRYNDNVYTTANISYSTSQNLYVPSNIDCIDFDIYATYNNNPSFGKNQAPIVLRIYLGFNLSNIDYVEFYRQGTFQSSTVLYTAYDAGYLYVFVNTIPTMADPGSYYTVRLHINHGDFTLNLDDINHVMFSYYYHSTLTNNTDSYYLELAQIHYLSELLYELENVNNIPDFDFDLSDIEQLITNIQNFLFNETGYTRFYLRPYDSGYGAYEQAVYKIPRDYGYAADNMHSNQRQAIVQQGIDNPYYTSIATYTSVVMLGFSITSPCKYVSINIPLGSWSSFNRTTDITMKYCIAPHTKSTSEFNTYIDNKVISFDKYYSNYATYDAHYDFDNVPYLSVNLYIPDTYYNLRDYCFYIFIESTTPAVQSFYLKQYYELSGKTYYIDVYGDNIFAHSAIDTMLLRNIYDAILGISIPSLPDYPTGPSAPNEETNIYDIDIEFNSQVGDIHAFENVYISMFADYNSDFTPSQYGNFDDSITATFTTMNGLLSDFYGSIFDTEEDEEDNIINHLSLGLFIIIPIIAFIVLALFRRVTA